MRGTDLLQHLLGNLREVDRVRLVLREHTCAARRPVSPRAPRAPCAAPRRRAAGGDNSLSGAPGPVSMLLMVLETIAACFSTENSCPSLDTSLIISFGFSASSSAMLGPSFLACSQRRLLRQASAPASADRLDRAKPGKHSQVELCTLQGATLCTYKKRADETLRTCRCGTPPAPSRRGERRAPCANRARHNTHSTFELVSLSNAGREARSRGRW